MKRKLLIGILLLCMLMSGCSGKKEDVTKASDWNGTVELIDAFLEGMEEPDKCVLTLYTNEELVSESTYDGDTIAIHYNDPTYPDTYMYEENGVRYTYMDAEGYEPFEDDFGFEITKMIGKNYLLTFLDSIKSEEFKDLPFEATLTKSQADGKERKVLNIVIKSEEDNATATLEGVVEGNRLMSYSHVEEKDGEKTTDMKGTFTYNEDVTIAIPEHQVKEKPVYNHVESPYATIGDVIDAVGEEMFSSLNTGEYLYAIVDMMQVRAYIDEELSTKLSELDFMDDDYTEKFNSLIRDLVIDDCVDFSNYVLTQEEMNAYVGRNVSDLTNEGFETNGYSIWEEGCNIWVEKDGIEYELNVKLPDDFDYEADFEYSDFDVAVINTMKFNTLSMSLMPLE